VNAGELGHVHTVDVNRFVDGDREEKIYDPDMWEHSLRGGRWAEILPHHVYQPYQFVDDLELLSVESRSLNEAYRPYLIADEVSIHLAHADGYVRIRYTANNEGKNRDMVIHGANGKIVTDAASNARMRLFGEDWVDLSGEDDDDRSSHAREIHQFVDYVQGEAPNPVDWDEAYTTMRLVDEISEELRAQHDDRMA
jgi:predicted dehydrogenase